MTTPAQMPEILIKKSGRRYGRPLHQVMDSGSRKFILDELRERVTGISVMAQVLAV